MSPQGEARLGSSAIYFRHRGWVSVKCPQTLSHLFFLSLSLASNSFTEQKQPFRASGQEDKSSSGAQGSKALPTEEGGKLPSGPERPFYTAAGLADREGWKRRQGRAGIGSYVPFCVTVLAEQHQGLSLESVSSPWPDH